MDPVLLLRFRELSPFLSNLGMQTPIIVADSGDRKNERREEQELSKS